MWVYRVRIYTQSIHTSYQVQHEQTQGHGDLCRILCGYIMLNTPLNHIKTHQIAVLASTNPNCDLGQCCSRVLWK